MTEVIKEHKLADDEFFPYCPLIIGEKKHASKYTSCEKNWAKDPIKSRKFFGNLFSDQ